MNDLEGSFSSQIHTDQAASEYRDPPPIDMLIFCPNCGKQHIDRPDPEIAELAALRKEFELSSYGDRPQSISAEKLKRLMALEADENSFWTNPVHKSHTCRSDEGGCGAVFRIADVPTNGVEAIKSVGQNDTWTVDVGDGRAL